MENNNKNDFSNVNYDTNVYPMKVNQAGVDRIRREHLLRNFIEVELSNKDSFLKIKETLTRMGVGSYKEKTVKQICHILHKKGRYYIVHYKELMAMDGEAVEFSVQDYLRRNQVAEALENWGMCKIRNFDVIEGMDDVYCHVIIIPYKDKKKWRMMSNYEVGAWTKEGA
jgi:Bacteriophage translational regulator